MNTTPTLNGSYASSGPSVAAVSLGAVMRIPRVTLHDAVLNQVRDMIIGGLLPPGARINEGLLGASLGVSRTPLREAIKTLASEGLVEIVPTKGAIIRRFDARDAREILEVLKALEQAAGRLTCERAPDTALAGIRTLHDTMVAAHNKRDRAEYARLNYVLHAAIVEAAGNGTLAQAHETVLTQIKRLGLIGHESDERWTALLGEHEHTIAALERRDAERAAQGLGRIVDLAIKHVRETL